MALHATQRQGIVFGWHPPAVAASSSLLLNAANTQLAYAFLAPRGGTLAKVKAYCTGKTGSPIAADAQCSLFSDSAAGIPNASLEAKTADGAPATGWMQYSGFTTSLTAGGRYWCVFKNLNATPASNNYNIATAGNNSIQSLPGGTQSATVGWGWMKLQTADGGATWAGVIVDGSMMRLEFGDGTFDGTSIQSCGGLATASNVFAAREIGVVFTVPANMKANVRRAAMYVNKTGTPTGNLRYRIYNGVTLQATSYVIPVGNVGAGNVWYESSFASDVVINGGDTIRVVASETTQSDTSTNRYVQFSAVVENDANSLLLKPIDGTLSRTETADSTAGPVVFADTATEIIPFALYLDTAGEFAAQATGGLVRANMSGGVL